MEEVCYFNAWRLTWARRDFAEKQDAFATELGIDLRTLRAYERGEKNPFRAHARPEVARFISKLEDLCGGNDEDPWKIETPKLVLRHHPADRHVVEDLARRLVAFGCDAWLDAWEVGTGANDLAARALRGAWAVLACCGANGVLDAWRDEAWWRKDRPRPVISVQLPGCPGPDVQELAPDAEVELSTIADLQPLFVKARLGHPEERVHRIAKLADLISPGAKRSPLKGLDAFTLSDARFFCGRRRDVDALLDQMRKNTFVAALGASGVGKSSLLNAGLVPAVLSGALSGVRSAWRVIAIHPQPDVPDALTACFEVLAGEIGLDRATAAAQPLDKRLDDWFASRPDTRLLIVIDPLEGLLTDTQQGATHIQAIHDLLAVAEHERGRDRFWVVAALRNDLFAELQLRFPALAGLAVAAGRAVNPICGEDLRELIEVPARIAGISIEDALVDRLVEDARGLNNALPLLQLTGKLLAEACQSTNRLTYSSYTVIGGLRGALQKHCHSLAGITPDDEILLRRILLRLIRLVRVEDSSKPASVPLRRRVPKSELDAISERIVTLLVHARLLVVHEDRASTPLVELAHELLVTCWDQLARWIDEFRDALTTAESLTRMQQEWSQHERSPRDLLRSARLTAILESLGIARPGLLSRLQGRIAWAESLVDVAGSEQRFVEASLRRATRSRAGMVAGVLVAVGSMATALRAQQGRCDVVPRFGACMQSPQRMPAHLGFETSTVPCQGRCIGDARSGLRITADMPETGQRWAVMQFERPSFDLRIHRSEFAANHPLRIAVASTRSATALEVKMVSDGSTVVYFSCPVKTGGTPWNLMIRSSDLTSQGVRMERVSEIGIGFSRDAGTPGGRQEIELFGVADDDAVQDGDQTTIGCTPRDANPG